MRVGIQIAAFARAGSFSPYTRVMGVSLCFVHLRKAYGSMRIESRAMAVEMPVRRGSRPRRGSWPNRAVPASAIVPQPLWEHARGRRPPWAPAAGLGQSSWPYPTSGPGSGISTTASQAAGLQLGMGTLIHAVLCQTVFKSGTAWTPLGRQIDVDGISLRSVHWHLRPRLRYLARLQ